MERFLFRTDEGIFYQVTGYYYDYYCGGGERINWGSVFLRNSTHVDMRVINKRVVSVVGVDLVG